MALDGMGLKDFRLFLLAQDQLDQAPEKGGGLEINMPLESRDCLGHPLRRHADGHGIPDASLRSDVPEKPIAVMKESADYLFEVFQKRPIKGKKWGLLAWHFMSSYFADALRVVRRNLMPLKWTACR